MQLRDHAFQWSFLPSLSDIVKVSFSWVRSGIVRVSISPDRSIRTLYHLDGLRWLFLTVGGLLSFAVLLIALGPHHLLSWIGQFFNVSWREVPGRRVRRLFCGNRWRSPSSMSK